MPDDEHDPYLEQRFPKLRPGLYRVKSPRDSKYNCFAFAANDTQHIWEYTGPGRLGGYFWPAEVRGDNLEDCIRMYGLLGFQVCENSDLEPDVVKIAIYVDRDSLPSHVARQTRRGTWKSKLGICGKDIEHDSLELLEGKVTIFEESKMSTPAKELKPDKAVDRGRAALAEWERAQSVNFYETDRHLQNILEFYWGADRMRARAPRLSKFGDEAFMIVDPAAQRANLAENLPKLDRYSAVGERTEDVAHSGDHHLAGRYIYGSGAMSVYAEPESNLLALALFYLSSYNGEAGHNCPLACTAGVIKTLQHAGSEELKAKYLPRLLDPNYETRFHGAQFLTEVQGGSDVGVNACVATLADRKEGKWLINGEKWFCSNVTADLTLVTARPEGSSAGTKGLGLFLVPRRLDDGTPNGIYIRRLKDKLGTKSLATAEVDFKDAVAYQIGEPGRGFQHAMDFVINTSRLYNAVGSAGAARRAYLIAWTYAQHRQAFGSAIKDFPLVRETLAEMRSTTMALTSGSLYLAHLRDEIEAGRGDEADKQFFRLAVNLNKYRSSISATDVIRRGIEILGGNGAMENFSVLPRLLRDSIIFEAWEGAHNTLLAQSVRDIQRYKLHEAFCSRLDGWFGSLADAGLRDEGVAQIAVLRSELDPLLSLDELSASVLFKPAADRMMWLFYTACLAREVEWEDANNKSIGKRAVIEWLWQRQIAGAGGKDLPGYLRLISEISAAL